MKLKLDEGGHAVVLDGNPVYVHDDGKDIPFDAKSTVGTIARLNQEAKSHREAKEVAEAKLGKIPPDFDFEAATKALSTVKNLSDKQLVDASEVDKLTAGRVQTALQDFESNKYKPLKTKYEALEVQLRDEKMGNAFARSKFIGEKMSIPSDMVQARFGSLLKLEDNRIVGYDVTGNRVFSRAKPGEPAEFDEWIETVVDQYPYKDDILKGTGASGSGAKGSAASGGAKTITRSKWDGMSQLERSTASRDGFKVVD